MKKYIFALLIMITIICYLFFTNKKSEPVTALNPDAKELQMLYKEGDAKKVSLLDLSEKYTLKYIKTLNDVEWKSDTNVGLDFFPNSYLYTTGNLIFDLKNSKVSLSSISPIKELGNSEYGSYPFKIENNQLIVSYNDSLDPSKLVILKLEKSWLVLEDTKTKTRWAFYKN